MIETEMRVGIKRKIALGMGLLLVVGAIGEVATYRREAWLADYQQLKADLAQGYANLDWVVAHRQLDLVALDAETTSALQSSVSRVQAWWALRQFIRAFRDPHLRLGTASGSMRSRVSSDWHRPTRADPAAPQRSPLPAGPPVEGCAAAGYEEGASAFSLPVASLPGWRLVSARPFPTGVVGDTAVLRIAAFGEDQYRSECEAVFTGAEGARELQLKVRARLQAELEKQLVQLRAEGIRRLVVDVTGNGGGTEWVREVIPLFTLRRMTRPASLGPTLRCDREPIWRGEAVCPLLEDQGVVEVLEGRGLWDGPLQVWVDGGTGSATEDFVAWLADNRVATVVGTRTAGAGCGYVNGGHVSVLPASGLAVRMPNCARFRRNGENEMEGVAPDRASAFDAAELAALLVEP